MVFKAYVASVSVRFYIFNTFWGHPLVLEDFAGHTKPVNAHLLCVMNYSGRRTVGKQK